MRVWVLLVMENERREQSNKDYITEKLLWNCENWYKILYRHRNVSLSSHPYLTRDIMRLFYTPEVPHPCHPHPYQFLEIQLIWNEEISRRLVSRCGGEGLRFTELKRKNLYLFSPFILIFFPLLFFSKYFFISLEEYSFIQNYLKRSLKWKAFSLLYN